MYSVSINQYANHFERYRNVSSQLIYGTVNTEKKPFLSIVIPTYRRTDFLKQAIDSAIQQKVNCIYYEIIVVNNDYQGENSSQLFRLMESYDCSYLFYYENKQNLGMFGNWNRCIELARSNWVAFLHDDDLLKDHYVQSIYHLITHTKSPDQIGYINYMGELLYENKALVRHTDEQSVFRSFMSTLKKDRFLKLTLNSAIINGASPMGPPSCGTLCNKAAVMKCGGFNPDYSPSGDVIFPLYMLQQGYKVYLAYENPGYYRVGVNTSLKAETMKAFIEFYAALQNCLSSQSLAARLYYRIFGNELLKYNTQTILRQADTLKLELELEEEICGRLMEADRTKYKVICGIKYIYNKWILLISLLKPKQI